MSKPPSCREVVLRSSFWAFAHTCLVFSRVSALCQFCEVFSMCLSLLNGINGADSLLTTLNRAQTCGTKDSNLHSSGNERGKLVGSQLNCQSRDKSTLRQSGNHRTIFFPTPHMHNILCVAGCEGLLLTASCK